MLEEFVHGLSGATFVLAVGMDVLVMGKELLQVTATQ